MLLDLVTDRRSNDSPIHVGTDQCSIFCTINLSSHSQPLHTFSNHRRSDHLAFNGNDGRPVDPCPISIAHGRSHQGTKHIL
jgi:hypothetical protein